MFHRSFAFLVAMLSLWGLSLPVAAATYNTILTVNAGASNTGKAAQILATIYDNTHAAIVSASNSPGGVAFAESAITPGSYWAAVSFNTNNFPVTVEFSPLSNGTQFSTFQIGNDRAAGVADGYTGALASGLSTTNGRVDVATSSRQPSGNVTVGGYAGGQDPATLILDTAASGHSTSGTVGAAIIAAGSAGDPWATALPGAYSPGQAGYVVGHNLDAQTSSRLPTSSYTAAPTVSQIAAVILSNPANLIATDSSGNVSLSSTTQNAIRDAVWAKVIDGSLNAQDVLVLNAASIVGAGTNSFNGTTHVNTGTRKRQDGTTNAFSVQTQYGSSQTALPATSTTTTVTTPLH